MTLGMLSVKMGPFGQAISRTEHQRKYPPPLRPSLLQSFTTYQLSSSLSLSFTSEHSFSAYCAECTL